ncbi:hypothetical protein ACHWQZ_G013102 [Mnemiopsis leidyi]
MDQWSNPRQSYINQQDNHYMMDTSAPINIMDMDASGPPRMVASDDIQIDCFNHDRIIERPMSPEVQKLVEDSSHGRISPTYARQELAKKLLNRRSMGELRQQNYTSGLSPGFHDSRAKLQRAQTTDFLNKKINKRPDAESLVHNNILRTGNSSGSKYVDPSLISRQNELAKAQLEDGIKQHLETRPGPLELVQNNIMQLSEPLNNVIKSGQVAFTANSRHPSFNKYREHHSPENFYDSIQASPENALSPESQVSDDIGSYQDEVRLNDLGPPSNESVTSAPTTTRTKHSSGAKNSPKVRRKNQKAKVWKFKYHEYKPPGSRDKDKSAAEKTQKNETPHEIIMKQQQLLLQLQVMQKNYPNYILPKTLDLLNELKEKSGNTAPSESHLNDMKVSALKEELKKRNLHTYGNKSQLVERLRPYVDKDMSPSASSRGKDPLLRSNSEGDMLASPESVLSQQPQRKSSQPFLSMEDGPNSGLRNSHISPGGLVNSNPSSNDVMDENCSIIDNLGSLMVESQDDYSNHGSHGSMNSEDLYSSRPARHVSSEQPPSYQEATNQYNQTSYSQLLSEQQHVEVPQQMMSQQQGGPAPQQQQQQQAGLQQQYIQQFPGQQVHGLITTQHQLNTQQQAQFQYSAPQQNSYQEMIPISQVQEMIPIPQVQPINTNNMYFNMQTQFRASNPPTAPTNHQVVQLTTQPQYMIIQQQQQTSQPISQQFTSRNEQYAVVPPQYLNTSLQQLRQVQQPRYVQQQVHQQRLNNQYQAGPAQHRQPAPDSLSIDHKLDNKNNISTPDVISIILGSPNTTPMLKKGDKVGDPFSTQPPPKDDNQISQYGGRYNSNQTPERRMLERQVLDRAVGDHNADRQMSNDDWLGANMPQDLLTPDTAHFSKLVTPGGESVFEFSNDHLLNNSCNNDQLMLSSRPATSQGCDVTSWAVT